MQQELEQLSYYNVPAHLPYELLCISAMQAGRVGWLMLLPAREKLKPVVGVLGCCCPDRAPEEPLSASLFSAAG